MTQSGILLIDKPEGPSSAHVVHQVKKILGAKKVGHLGTLDPFASGLLIIGINDGTKIAEIFLGASKTYRGMMTLGIATDSQDSTGNVVEIRSVPTVNEREMIELQNKFTGDLQQIPPMFSALKKGGVPLYRLARQGKEVPREPRSVKIENICLRKLNDAEIEFEVTCSRGTYVRTLAADMGKELGCGAHLKTLRRTGCGHLSVTQAVPLNELEKLAMEKKLPLISLASALCHLRAVTWQSSWVSRLRLGQQTLLNQLGEPVSGEKLVCIQDPRREIVALAEWNSQVPTGWKLVRVFHAQ